MAPMTVTPTPMTITTNNMPATTTSSTKIIKYVYPQVKVFDKSVEYFPCKEIEITYTDSARTIKYDKPCVLRKVIEIGDTNTDEPLVVCIHKSNVFYGLIREEKLVALSEDEWGTLAVFDLGLSRRHPHVPISEHAEDIMSLVNSYIEL
jgi:hypothetical protein